MTFYKLNTFHSVLTAQKNEIKVHNTILSSSFCSSRNFMIDYWWVKIRFTNWLGKVHAFPMYLKPTVLHSSLTTPLELPSSGSSCNADNTLFSLTGSSSSASHRWLQLCLPQRAGTKHLPELHRKNPASFLHFVVSCWTRFWVASDKAGRGLVQNNRMRKFRGSEVEMRW